VQKKKNVVVISTLPKIVIRGEGLVENVAIPSTFTKRITRGEGLVENAIALAMSK
jgi:hypothetical protein